MDFPRGGSEDLLEFRGRVVGVPDDVGITLAFVCGSIETRDFVSASCQSQSEVLKENTDITTWPPL